MSKTIWTPGSNLLFPIAFSWNVKNDKNLHHQLHDKKVPQDFQFFDDHGEQITYKINHEDAAD